MKVSRQYDRRTHPATWIGSDVDSQGVMCKWLVLDVNVRGHIERWLIVHANELGVFDLGIVKVRDLAEDYAPDRLACCNSRSIPKSNIPSGVTLLYPHSEHLHLHYSPETKYVEITAYEEVKTWSAT